MSVSTIIAIIVNSICGLWLIGLAIFVIVKKIKLKKQVNEEVKVYEEKDEIKG